MAPGAHSDRLEPIGTRIGSVQGSGVRDISTCEEAQASPGDERVDQLQHEFYPPALRPSLNRISEHTDTTGSLPPGEVGWTEPCRKPPDRAAQITADPPGIRAAAPSASPPPSPSWHPTTPAASTASTSRSTADSPRSEPCAEAGDQRTDARRDRRWAGGGMGRELHGGRRKARFPRPDTGYLIWEGYEMQGMALQSRGTANRCGTAALTASEVWRYARSRTRRRLAASRSSSRPATSGAAAARYWARRAAELAAQPRGLRASNFPTKSRLDHERIVLRRFRLRRCPARH
jgi:hypothetical protein